MRRISRAVVVAFVLAACLALLAVATQAAGGSAGSAPAYGDPATTFTLTGRTLTVSSTDPVVLDVVRGRQLALGCDGLPWCDTGQVRHGLPPRIVAVWAEHASSVRFQRVPADVNWVELQVGAGGPALFGLIVADAAFTPAGRKHMRYLGAALAPAQSIARQNLRRENSTIQFVLTLNPANTNRFGLVRKFPSAQTIVTDVDESCFGRSGAARTCAKPKSSSVTRLLYAPTLAGVTQPDYAYVVGAGTNAKMLELVNIGVDRRLYILRAKPNAQLGTFSSPQPS